MSLASCVVDFVPLASFVLSAGLLEHGIHRVAYSRREVLL